MFGSCGSLLSVAQGSSMTATLLLILGSLAAVAALSVVAAFLLHRSHGKLSLVGQVPVAPLHASQPAFVLAKVGERRAPNPTDHGWISGLTKTEAEDCLDWLEANGYTHREVALLG